MICTLCLKQQKFAHSMNMFLLRHDDGSKHRHVANGPSGPFDAKATSYTTTTIHVAGPTVCKPSGAASNDAAASVHAASTGSNASSNALPQCSHASKSNAAWFHTRGAITSSTTTAMHVPTNDTCAKHSCISATNTATCTNA